MHGLKLKQNLLIGEKFHVYCNNNSNKYIFAYTNPLANIKGTKLMSQLKNSGAGWRMPTRDEALELMVCLYWKKKRFLG